ncbi:hypothetical protein SAMN06264364_1068 [Quadrisphaera granulorum]|uniref:Uncharacterized protein n=1 Tax=Quadrisphaera granulorum TaxID=317664 RepID=A0A316A9G9_9ACTN|nr:hypothetical protein BXY45_1068 [Quadrisphaera granulorum]SZE95928.1 hypothetical protein SAMN06264364_1068 [Quadrisphaera granulorum]
MMLTPRLGPRPTTSDEGPHRQPVLTGDRHWAQLRSDGLRASVYVY